ncbi:phytochelatin synthase family protein [Pseudorhodobacter sp. W20_MBD10_FR17]|uniref:phytochelatin synthase family protein n=1 Tax=Pseudorhodobacter sp. W20_MBD10_FR17 TaxID=3240266 RepID=UPI003F9EB495
MRLSLALLFTTLALPAIAQDAPKLGPNATPITSDTTFLRTNPAPDYWAFSAFVKPQFTASACSIASVTAALNGLNGLPPLAEEQIMSQQSLLALTGNVEWLALSSEDGAGVKFDQLASFTQQALTATGSKKVVDTFHPKDAAGADEMRKLLTENEASADDALLVYFNQGVVTGDWDGPHISLIGAYDAQSDRVLILEVDQDWYIPYWTPASVLLDAMLKPTSADHGPLLGETGGFVYIH